MESFNPMESMETPPTREEMVEALKNRGVEDPEARSMLTRYVEAQEQVTDTIGGPHSHEEVALHMAEVYFDDGYQEEAVQSLEEMLDTMEYVPDEGESSNESNADFDELYQKVKNLLRKFTDKME